MTESTTRPEDLLPLRPVVFAVLLALGERQLHGYGIMKDVNRRLHSAAIVGPGTLYRTLKEMRGKDLIEHAASIQGVDGRRQYYRLTEIGRRTARAEAKRMARLVRDARDQRLLPQGGGFG